MRAVVLGSRGQVGYELVRSLAPFMEVVPLGREEAPLDDPVRLTNAVLAAEPDVILNAAAYTAVDRAESEPDLAHVANAEAPAALASLGVRLVHFSTDYVFDGRSDRPYREEDPTNPLGVYGVTKLAGEQAVLETDPRHLVLRVSWVYGTRGRNFLLTMRRLAAEGKPLRIVDDQQGAPTWCRMIAQATALATLSLDSDEPGGLYHLPAGGETTWYGFARAILGGTEITPIATADYPTPAARPANSLLDGSAFEDRFGFLLPDWREQLRMAVEE
ncbi:dTDP-4-dehydrorhamnose reductase [soil metagenome]